MPVCPLVVWLLSLISLYHPWAVCAQDYSVPSSWQDVVSNSSYAERLTAAQGAANEVYRRINPLRGKPTDSTLYVAGSTLATSFALQDYHSGNNSWKSQVINNTLHLYESGNPALDNEHNANVIAYYGLAEVVAYLTYNDSARLEVAKQKFDQVYNDFIDASAVQSARYPRPFNTTCGSTLAGLVFYSHNNATDLFVASNTIGYWIVLGARLAELTSNASYLSAAEQSIQFMQTHIINLNFSSAIISHEFNVTTCTTGPHSFAWDIGSYIEGLSIVANITQNTNYTEMLNNLIPAVLVIPEWHDDTGILIEDEPLSKGTLIRGLVEARLRNPSNTAMINLIDTYITRQYNAVVKNASIGGDDYKVSWLGDGAARYITPGNLAALDVLNAAFIISPTDASPESPSHTAPTRSPGGSANSTNAFHKGASTRIGTIVGATVGGVAVAAVIATLCIHQHRRRYARRMGMRNEQSGAIDAATNSSTLSTGLTPEPFILTAPSTRHQSTLGLVKGDRYRRHMSLPHEDRGHGTPHRPASAPDAIIDTSIAQIRPVSESLQALERRIEHLVSTLFNHGEDNPPPEYDGNNTHSAQGNMIPV